MKFSRAFTIIELIFVIVVLAILASVALPKFEDTREMADIAKGRGDVATIRSAIANERQTQVIKGVNTYISRLTPSTASTILFTGDGAGRTLLSYGIKKGSNSGEWNIVSDTRYTFKVGSSTNTFDYTSSNGKFLCTTGTECPALSE